MERQRQKLPICVNLCSFSPAVHGFGKNCHIWHIYMHIRARRSKLGNFFAKMPPYMCKLSSKDLIDINLCWLQDRDQDQNQEKTKFESMIKIKSLTKTRPYAGDHVGGAWSILLTMWKYLENGNGIDCYGNDYRLQKVRLSSSNLRHMHEQVGGQGAEARGRRRDAISKTQTGCNLLKEIVTGTIIWWC